MANRSFSINIDSNQLSKGLRPSKRLPRNSGYLVECEGAVGKNNVLKTLDELTRIDTSAITASFPYPQIFVFTNLIILCSETKIYEWVSGAPVEKLTVSAGSTWTAIDFYEYIYMSNGNAAVIRDSGNGTYSTTTEIPTAMAAMDYKGQVLVGGPDVAV